MGKTRAQLRAKWAEREAEYQRMLGRGTEDGQDASETDVSPLPPEPVRTSGGRRPVVRAADAKPYKVDCPRCAAPAGRPCLTGSGKPVRPHADRVREAAEWSARQPPEAVPDEEGGAARPNPLGLPHLDFPGRYAAAVSDGG
ncbi:hypothetical protein LO762_21635 [Actinocorallia sp. API 0066]|uniref:zinc finger domain-containing protein n=1 Tax=Actinocorallia sp. API 0066 TaxID=2896846 RepID=UPI001E3EB67D|nr:hypothetical protein [Actinocorallia sp. API 0066]MCD0451776.1 hypothetical protein [Actinocorallia sp. API 0066]